MPLIEEMIEKTPLKIQIQLPNKEIIESNVSIENNIDQNIIPDKLQFKIPINLQFHLDVDVQNYEENRQEIGLPITIKLTFPDKIFN